MALTLNFTETELALVAKYAEKQQISIEDFIHESAMKAARNAEYLEKLARADEQIRAGQVVVKTMEELEAMAQ